MKIWKRYLFFSLTKTFLFFLLCLFFIYLIIDLSIHGVRFLSSSSILDVTIYYLRTFAKHLDLFFPLTFLLSFLKVLLHLSSHHELTALQMAGLSSKKLLSPFFTFATILAAISLLNHQLFSPNAQEAIDTFRINHAKLKKKQVKEYVHHVTLQDNSELIYQNFDAKTGTLFDVFWIKNKKEIWHIKHLTTSLPPVGKNVDCFQRNAEDVLEKTESFLTHTFQDLYFLKDARFEKFIPFENRSLATLAQQAFTTKSEKQAIFSHLYYKLATPLLPLLLLFTISPIAMQFSRTKPTFLIVAISLFAFISFMTLLEGMLILSENQVLPPWAAIWGPMVCLAASRMRLNISRKYSIP